MSHTVLTCPETFAACMKVMLLLGVVCKKSLTITEGVEGDVIIQDQLEKSAVVRRKHLFQLIGCAKVVRGFVVSSLTLYFDKSRTML